MKTINETFEDNEFNELLTIKGSMSWHDFIMLLIDYKEGGDQEGGNE